MAICRLDKFRPPTVYTRKLEARLEGALARKDKLQAENKELKEKVRFLTKYDADVDGPQTENERYKKAINYAVRQFELIYTGHQHHQHPHGGCLLCSFYKILKES